MYFRRLDPDSPASRGDLEALLEAQREVVWRLANFTTDAYSFTAFPSRLGLKDLTRAGERLIEADGALRKLEKSLSPREEPEAGELPEVKL